MWTRIVAWWKRRTRKQKIWLVVAILVLGFIAIPVEDDEAGPAPVAAVPEQDTTTVPEQDTTTVTRAVVVEARFFDRGMVEVEILSKVNQGGQFEVYFVNDELGVDLLQAAWDCVEDYTGGGVASAYCYAFSSVEDFEYSEVDETNGGLVNVCWSARASVAIAGNTCEGEGPIDSGCPSDQ